MNRITDTLLRKLNDLEIERDLARYFAEDGNWTAASECFRSAQALMHEINALFSRTSRARTSPTLA